NEIYQSIVSIQTVDFDEANEDEDPWVGYASGTIITEHGDILTNFHVVENAIEPGEISDIIYICHTYEIKHMPICSEVGSVIAYSEFFDLALISPVAIYDPYLDTFVDIDRSNDIKYPYAIFTNDSISENDLPELNEKITVAGFPYDAGNFQLNVTSGIVSGYDSYYFESIGKELVMNLLTDATINEGNSGGAAFNEFGEFIGVPSAGTVAEGGSYGYIIPLNIINYWINSLVESGEIYWHPITYSSGHIIDSEIEQILEIKEKQSEISEKQENIERQSIKDQIEIDELNEQIEQLLDENEKLHQSAQSFQNSLNQKFYLIYGVIGIFSILVIAILVKTRIRKNNTKDL
ncbi:trypsin-like peptidase domain-containing protein, partial [Patescibacteria group bacterium]